DCLQQVLTAAKDAADRQEVDVPRGECWPKVYFPERRMKDLWQLLLDNALLYRHLDKPLRIRVTATRHQQRVVFRFEDNGPGIPLAYREQVFEIFARLVPNSDRYPGTGMGLA